MRSSRGILCFIVGFACIAASVCSPSVAAPPPPPADAAPSEAIVEDVISAAENTTQKIIRVNPLNLPPVRDSSAFHSTNSSVYKIQSLPTPQTDFAVHKNVIRDSLQLKGTPSQLQKQKQPQQQQQQKLNFLFNQPNVEGSAAVEVGKLEVRVAAGAYPVYYALSKTNGNLALQGVYKQQEFEKNLRTPQH